MKILLNLSSALLSWRLVLEKHTLMQLNLKLINYTAAHLLIAHHLPELIECAFPLFKKKNNKSFHHWPKQTPELPTFNTGHKWPEHSSGSPVAVQDPIRQLLKSRWSFTCQELARPTSPGPRKTPAQPRRGAWHEGAHRGVPPLQAQNWSAPETRTCPTRPWHRPHKAPKQGQGCCRAGARARPVPDRSPGNTSQGQGLRGHRAARSLYLKRGRRAGDAV